MPLLKIQTNLAIEADAAQQLIREASAQLAGELGKPEGYVMVSLEPQAAMIFGGADAPAAYLEVKSIGLPENQTAELSRMLCALIEKSLGIAAKRIYIEFANAPGRLWGWNSSTF